MASVCFPPLVTLPSPGPKFLSLGTHFLVLGIILYFYIYIHIYIYIYLFTWNILSHFRIAFCNSCGVLVAVSPSLSSMGLVAGNGK